MKKKIIIAVIIVIIVGLIIVGNIIKDENEKSYKLNILTSFYPIYIMTSNITDGAQNVKVSNMAEKIQGCIHDYTLSTEDLKKFETSDVFIQCGNGLENFSDKIKELYKDIIIIDSAKNVTNLIEDEEEVNAHIWLSLDNYVLQVNAITEELKKLDLNNSSVYENNRQRYIGELNSLKEKFETLNFINYKSICLNEALVYLLDEVGMDVTSIETDHDQSALSAEQLKEIINKMNSENIKAIFIDKDDDAKIAETIKLETNANIYVLNSGMNGNNDLNSYIEIMNDNYKVLDELRKE